MNDDCEYDANRLRVGFGEASNSVRSLGALVPALRELPRVLCSSKALLGLSNVFQAKHLHLREKKQSERVPRACSRTKRLPLRPWPVAGTPGAKGVSVVRYSQSKTINERRNNEQQRQEGIKSRTTGKDRRWRAFQTG